ncbi:MAG: acyl-CoA thioesterase [Lentisphaerota bacterium]
MTRRAQKVYFEREPGSPAPLRWSGQRRVRFNEVDPMAIVWFGRYAIYFEEATAELCRRCGLSYGDFLRTGLRAPVATYHVDYLQPLHLDEEFTLSCSLIWNEGARLNSEYEIVKKDGSVAARGWTVQLFIDAATSEVCLITPPLLAACRHQWKAGHFKDLQA